MRDLSATNGAAVANAISSSDVATDNGGAALGDNTDFDELRAEDTRYSLNANEVECSFHFNLGKIRHDIRLDTLEFQ